jgi:hypothetical protein
VGADTAVRFPCGAYTLNRDGTQSCRVNYFYDSLVSQGFGPFAPVSPDLQSCRSSGAVDTLTFGRITGPDAEVGDFGGVEFVFQRVLDSLRGYTREGEGGVSGPRTLLDLKFDPVAKRYTFWTTGGGRTMLDFKAAITCREIHTAFRFINAAYGSDPADTSEWYNDSNPRAKHPYRDRP